VHRWVGGDGCDVSFETMMNTMLPPKIVHARAFEPDVTPGITSLEGIA